jgi:16S rRNA (adenine1518-N6/adenine1519-N6)-dimethyltransferase
MWSDPRIAFLVKPTCFFPQPSVTSAVVTCTLHPPRAELPFDAFFDFTRKTFQGRRKMLRSSCREWGSQRVETLLAQLGLSPLARPQELSCDDFIALFSALQERA